MTAWAAGPRACRIATRPGGQVSSPTDGWVVYAGPFRSYGQLLIINAGDGYHVLLAGMERMDVQLGQFVLAGEPVAVMAEQRLASVGAVDIGATQPVLYIEFRKDGTSIDPAPWWAASNVGKGWRMMRKATLLIAGVLLGAAATAAVTQPQLFAGAEANAAAIRHLSRTQSVRRRLRARARRLRRSCPTTTS